MAELRKNNSQELIYLTKYHLFGRKKQVVTTHLDHPNISRIHVLFEWKDNNWVMQDKSRNGVWLNGKRINREYDYPIKAGDNIDLTSTADIGFTVVNIDPPKNALIAYSNNETSQSLPSVIFLDQLNLLPNESSPEVVLAYDPEHNAWTCENTEQMVAHPVEDGDKICFASTEWKLITGLDKDDVQTAALDKKESEDVKYVFRISQDEEFAELKIRHKETTIDLDIRSHHYLTALLARYKNKTGQNELDENFRGWISIKKLSKDLGLSESHVNIQIHRARKQLMEQFQRLNLIAPSLIERRRGYARFASDNFSIFKGDALET